MNAETPQMITLTDAAAARVKMLIESSDDKVLGLRVGISTKGCSGMSYVFEYAKEKQPYEEEIETKGVKVFIDPMATMYLAGTEMDYVQQDLAATFVFRNPNETGRCGCGESFSV